jgi:hypothetical protein
MTKKASQKRTNAFFTARAETDNPTISAERNIDLPKSVSYIRHQ